MKFLPCFTEKLNVLKLNLPQRVLCSGMWHVCWKFVDVSEGCAASLHLQERRKGGSSMFHCSIDKRLSDYTVLHPRGQSSLYPLPWEPQISQNPISAVSWTLNDSSETYLWVVLLCEAIQVNNPTTVVVIRQQMCSVFLRALCAEVVLDSELQKSDSVIQFLSLKY